MNRKNVDWLTRGAGIGAIFFTILTSILAFLYLRSTLQSAGPAQLEGEPATYINPTSTESSNPLSTNTAVPSPTRKLTTTGNSFSIQTTDNGWQYYQNNVFNYSLLLPPSWAVIDLSSGNNKDSVADAIANYPALGLYFSEKDLSDLIPTKFKLFAIDTNPELLTSGSVISFSIMISDFPAEVSFDQYFDYIRAGYKSAYGEQFQFTQEHILLGKSDGIRIAFRDESETASDQDEVRQYLVLIGKTEYIFTSSLDAHSETEYLPVIDQIAQSWRLGE